MTQYRLDAVLLCDVRIRWENGELSLPDAWTKGPYVYQYVDHTKRSVRTDAKARATTYPVTLAPYLFGASAPGGEVLSGEVRLCLGPSERAWSIAQGMAPSSLLELSPEAVEAVLERACVSRTSAQITLGGVELLAQGLVDTGRGMVSGVVAVHLAVFAEQSDSAIAIVNALSQIRGDVEDANVRGYLLHRLLGALEGFKGSGIEFPRSIEAGTEGSVYSLVLAERGNLEEPQSVLRAKEQGVVANVTELYCLASTQKSSSRHVNDDRLTSAVGDVRTLSKDWSMLALRHGAAFQLHLSDPDFLKFSTLYFRTLYADAFMLSRLQDQIVRAWEVKTAQIIGGVSGEIALDRLKPELAALNRSIVIDGTKYWIMRSVANTGRAIEFVRHAQDAVRLPARIAAIAEQVQRLDQLADRDARDRQTIAQESQVRVQERLSVFVFVFGVFVFPLTVSADILQMLKIEASPPVLLAIVGASIGLAFFAARIMRRLRRHANTREP